MMIYLLKNIRRSAVILLSALALCVGGFVQDAAGQEAPRDSGSLIKPPTIKPPTARSQNNNAGTTGTKRKKSRRRRARRRAVATAPSKTAPRPTVYSKSSGPGSTTTMVGGAAGNTMSNMVAIKPPTVTAEGGTLAATAPRPRKPVSGGVLNGKATSLPRPPFPPIARAARASGTVVVQVLVDEEGNVAEANAISGHPLLQNAAKEAALQAKFPPTMLGGQAVKVTGVITYEFVPD